ncbi:o-succinylbenzoate synthase [Planosporangium flavigriseum]|uniref:o-succinylbenzoate synthase n=1 Tax=Planosporangium flavigriseum TaxID=373681 RepID=A0A8J3PPW5_9ACTN|nr:o-succinylbenzoate synthase [Planosporangium flavigriseum]NJC67346.1 o-succinylbenzoate synthase [Planosporangium flavigriseum]GIG75431.1 o-succinylbenzoate synthase [Planosporangium flavigriseum]
MKLEAVELRRIDIPLVRPFRTSFGEQITRDVLLVQASTDEGTGWGECVALADPVYSSEYVAGAEAVIADHLLPRLFTQQDLTARSVGPALRGVLGHRMAKAALEMAVLDAELRSYGISLGRYLGAERARVECGVSVGIAPTIDALLDEVGGYVAQGYRRIKLKIQPGWDLEPVRAVRDAFGVDLPLQVDANTAYDAATAPRLHALDEYGLLLIEQPFAEEDLHQHALLARRLVTPVCLDESVVSAAVAADAINRGACGVVNIKPGRVGGYLEAVRVHDVCAALGVPVWCGGMLETGIGRAANVALAALPNFRLPGDTSASDRYYAQDITEPFVLVDGQLAVPTGPGIGVEPRLDVLESMTTRVRTVRP